MGLMGLMGGWERDSAMGIAERDFYRTGETRLQGKGKGVTWRGKREKREKVFPNGKKRYQRTTKSTGGGPMVGFPRFPNPDL